MLDQLLMDPDNPDQVVFHIHRSTTIGQIEGIWKFHNLVAAVKAHLHANYEPFEWNLMAISNEVVQIKFPTRALAMRFKLEYEGVSA